MKTHFSSVAVIGLGLIGSSFAANVSQRISRCASRGYCFEHAVKAAQERGWIDEGHVSSEDLGSVLCSCELVMIATPSPVASEYFRIIAACDFKGVVTDACSTKKIVSRQEQELLRYPEKYIPGHPMAGSEKSGIEGARRYVQRRSLGCCVPMRETSRQTITPIFAKRFRVLARVRGFLPRDKHDEAVAGRIGRAAHFAVSSLVELAVRHADDQEALFRLSLVDLRILLASPQDPLRFVDGMPFDKPRGNRGGLTRCSLFCVVMQIRCAKAIRPGSPSCSTELRRPVGPFQPNGFPQPKTFLGSSIRFTNRPNIIAEVTTIAGKPG